MALGPSPGTLADSWGRMGNGATHVALDRFQLHKSLLGDVCFACVEEDPDVNVTCNLLESEIKHRKMKNDDEIMRI